MVRQALLGLGVAALLQGCAGVPSQPDAGDAAAVRQRAADEALALVGAPYRFGGTSPESGFDCSGLVHYAFRKVGWSVPRSTDEQQRRSVRISSRELRAGDLLFFDQDGKKNSHVGLYLGDGKFVHAPSRHRATRTDALSSPYWRRHFSEARRLVRPGEL